MWLKMKNHENQLRKLYIECGTTLRSPVKTGIQRVVRNIIEFSGCLAPHFGFDSTLVDFNGAFFAPVLYGGDFFTPELQGKTRAAPERSEVVKDAVLKMLRAINRTIRNNYKLDFYSHLVDKHKGRIRRWLEPGSEMQDRIVFPSMIPSGKPPVLLLLDSTWNNAIWAQIDEFRSNGGLVCAVLYDLIPFTHPDTVFELTRAAHTGWWAQAPQHVDAIMCISQSVRQDYLAWQERYKVPHPLPPDKIGYFYLGAEVANADPVVRLLTESEPYFLMVGSLEPRKNHKTVLDAFEQLWARGVTARLAVVGAFGWKSEELLARIENHPQRDRQLFLIRDATDRDLAGLYGKTTALIVASLAEGFGLPIVEACQHRARVICSEIPVFREVAGQGARYFDVLSPNSLVDCVLDCLQENALGDSVSPAGGQTWISWRESAEQLLEKVSRFEK